ncbi:polyprenyl synthetase family protein [Prevotellamassilia timonensis]|uniref:polyprenyl synthetase family protein n=1 Tax=Prevotellamassilia timonensis TaxID=1852370 RepID=UPI003A9402E7
MDKLAAIRQPVLQEMAQYKALFDNALTHDDDFLGQALDYVRRRQGKMMRPLLVVLMARELGDVSVDSLRSAVTLELLHTASLVHDDVVDESGERRGQRSVNAVYDNKVAVLVGDYLLSTSLLQAAMTGNIGVVEIISRLGGTLSEGEIFQLANIRNEAITEEAYFHIIHHKTAALFAACAELGAISAGADAEYVARAKRFGEIVGLCFQIRDDIFDYYADNRIGKPTGNDMREGKLTLPAIYAINNADNQDVRALAMRVKNGEATADDIAALVDYTKAHGGIEYAQRRMEEFHAQALSLLDSWHNAEVREALRGYIDFVVERSL